MPMNTDNNCHVYIFNEGDLTFVSVTYIVENGIKICLK